MARDYLNRAVLGRFNPTVLVMSDDAIRAFVTEHAPDIRNDIPDSTVTEDDLQEQVIMALSRWLHLDIRDWGHWTEVELKDILYLQKRFYPGGRRPEMSRDFTITMHGNRVNIIITK